MSKVTDQAISLCPCCHAKNKNQHHFLHSPKNPSRINSVKLLNKTLISTDNYPYGVIIASGLAQYLEQPEQRVDIPYHKHPLQFHLVTKEAARQQLDIGWHHLLHSNIMAIA